jgi:cytochrome oxidase Cu insertion factor (SCO1/SenC/PrrC family)
MNIVRFFTLSMLTFLSFSTIKAQKVHQINLQIKGYTEGSSVKLVGNYAEQTFLADTARFAAEGKIQFKNVEGFAEGLYYVLLPDDRNCAFFVVNGEDSLTIRSEKANLTLGLTAEGSLENQLFFDNNRYQSALEAKYNALNQQLRTAQPTEQAALKTQLQTLLDERDAKVETLRTQYPTALFPKFKQAGQNPKLRFSFLPNGALDSTATMINFRKDWWNGCDFTDARLARTPVFFNKLKKYIDEYTPQSPDSIIAAADFLLAKTLPNKELHKPVIGWLLSKYKPMQTKLMDGEAVYSYLILKYMTPDMFPDIDEKDLKTTLDRARDMRSSLVGMIGQNVWGKDRNGLKKTLYDLNAPVKVVYIFYTDCEHCQEETPKLRKVYDEWKRRGVEIFSIAANVKERADWLNFETKYGINWTSVMDPNLESKFNEKYFVDNTPEIYVLDKNYRIIAKNLKPEQLPEVFERELSKEQKIKN